MLISGDIGGTNTRLQAICCQTQQVLGIQRYQGADFESFEAILAAFMEDQAIQATSVQAICLAVAGPIAQGQVILTNLPWQLSEAGIARAFGLKQRQVQLMNDFAAIGYGLPTLNENDYVTLQSGDKKTNAPMATVGAGTGIGMAIVQPGHPFAQVFPTEGGHQDFAPTDDEQIKLFEFLKRKLHRVSIERVCSGLGILNIFRFAEAHPVYQQRPDPELLRQLNQTQARSAAAKLIIHFAVNHHDPVALRTLDIFVRIYGSVVGNMALACLPYQGMYVTGGIGPHILTHLTDGRFLGHFLDKGRVSDTLKAVPLYIVTQADVGLKGASEYGLCLINDQKML